MYRNLLIINNYLFIPERLAALKLLHSLYASQPI
jgi:hypothetical protein